MCNAEHRLNICVNVSRILWWAGKQAAGVIIRRDGEPGTCCHQDSGRSRAEPRHGDHQESHEVPRHYRNPRNVLNIIGIPWNAPNIVRVLRNLLGITSRTHRKYSKRADTLIRPQVCLKWAPSPGMMSSCSTITIQQPKPVTSSHGLVLQTSTVWLACCPVVS